MSGRAFIATRGVTVVSATVLVWACSEEPSPSPQPVDSPDELKAMPIAPGAAPAGIWTGEDSEGREIRLFVKETGVFHFVYPETGVYGEAWTGLLTDDPVTRQHYDDTQIGRYNFGFQPFYPLEQQPHPENEWWWNICTIVADAEPGKALTGTMDCPSLFGSEFTAVEVQLAYHESYELAADLHRFVGNWTDQSDPGADVVTFHPDGMLTGQHGTTGCIYSGKVSVADPRYNIYDIEWTFHNCPGTLSRLNGVVFEGMASIDPTTDPVSLWLLAFGKVPVEGLIPGSPSDRIAVSLLKIWQRM